EPDCAHAASRVIQTQRRRHVNELAAGVSEEHVRAILKRDEEIEIAVRVEIDPRGLADRASLETKAGHRGDLGESSRIIPVEPQYGAVARREANQEIGIAVAIHITPGSGASSARVRQPGSA